MAMVVVERVVLEVLALLSFVILINMLTSILLLLATSKK
jgi:hypothetical protein